MLSKGLTADNEMALHVRRGQVDVWSFRHPQEFDRRRALTTLSDDEVAHCSRFCSTELRDRFLLSRSFLRTLLGRYLQLNPSDLEIVRGLHGKPEVAVDHCLPQQLKFSTTHSGSFTLCAVTSGMDVGIDIERARTVHDVDQICERFFSAPEVDIFRNIGVAQQQQAFFRCWTAKEAFVKATGEGLSRPLDSFSVVFSPGETLHLASIDDNKESALNWHLIELEPPEPDYHVAMAIRSGRSRHVDVARFQWIE